MRTFLALATAVALILAVSPAHAVTWCGGVKDDCQCGAYNPYPCCDNGYGRSSNCTWGSWHMACCKWGKGLPGWSHAKFWAGNAAAHPDYEVHGSSKKGAIACRATGTWGHVAYVTEVSGGQVKVHEQSCCEGASCWPNCSYCINGFADTWYNASYYTGGFILPKGAVKFCGDGSCNNGENCGSCPKDCGSCCGNGKCDNGESCKSCSKDCGSCCGNGKCDNGESCKSCSKDCGDCCGNGKCDNGEDCASCEKDCGICNEKPVGALEVANCERLAGWALDPDVDNAIGVRLKADGNQFKEQTANEAHPSHNGHGFTYLLGHDLKNGEVHTIEVIAEDDKGLADSPIDGSGKKVLCRNGVLKHGIWRLEYHDAAGVEIEPVAGEAGWTTLRLFHNGGEAWPTAGLVQAAADISLTPFEKVTAERCGGFGSALYHGEIGVADQVLGMGNDVQPCKSVELAGPGHGISASLAALGMEYDQDARECRLEKLSFWSHGWQFGYSAQADGHWWGNDSVDRLRFAGREGAAECRGQVRARRTFDRPFTGLEIMAGDSPSPPVRLRFADGEEIDLDECLVNGRCAVSDIESDVLEIIADCGDGTAAPAGWSRTLTGLRVFRAVEEEMLPWTVRGDRVWGLAASLPPATSAGLTLRLSTQENDFVPFGALQGEVTLPAPDIEEVRGMLTHSLPGQCYQGFLTMDGKPVQVAAFGQGAEPFTVKGPGTSFGLALTATEGCTAGPIDAFWEVSNVSFRRQGWWTTPAVYFAGIRDGRTDDCGVRFDNLKWWGMLGNKASGSLLVHRYLDGQFHGLRYRWAHSFEGPFFKARVLLDGKPVKEHPLQSPTQRTEEITGRTFSEVGVLFAVTASDVFDYKWSLTVDQIEVLDGAGRWVPLCEVGEAAPDLEGVQPASDADVLALPDAVAEPTPDRAGGCATGHPARAGVWTLLAVLTLALALRRRRSRSSV